MLRRLLGNNNVPVFGFVLKRNSSLSGAVGRQHLEHLSGPDKFYKGRSQEKTHLLRLDFFLLLSPLDRARSVLTFRAMCSVAGHSGPAVWVSATSGFHCLFATKLVSSETSKAERRSVGDHSSIRDSWPIAFSGYPRGPSLDYSRYAVAWTAPRMRHWNQEK